jgi:hypothetical protein
LLFPAGQRKVSTCPSKYIRIPVIAIAAAAGGGSGLLYANSKHRDSGEIPFLEDTPFDLAR